MIPTISPNAFFKYVYFVDVDKLLSPVIKEISVVLLYTNPTICPEESYSSVWPLSLFSDKILSPLNSYSFIKVYLLSVLDHLQNILLVTFP